MALELYHPNKDGVVIYRTEDNTLQLDVQLAEETVWLCGYEYRKYLSPKFKNSVAPLKNLGIGKQLAWYKSKLS
jgi:hypothetical protein